MSSEGEHELRGRQHPSDELRLVRDFVNTLHIDGAPAQSARPRGLAGWLAARGLVEQGATIPPADLDLVRELREALRALLVANAGEPVDMAALETLNRIGRPALLRTQFDNDGAARLEPATRGIDAALGRLLATVVVAMRDSNWTRLKVCRAGSCHLAFYDASKNRSGAWCSMALCGNRNKVREYQQRRRGALAQRVATSQ